MQAENCNSARLRLTLLQFLPALLAQLIPNTTAPHPITYTNTVRISVNLVDDELRAKLYVCT